MALGFPHVLSATPPLVIDFMTCYFRICLFYWLSNITSTNFLICILISLGVVPVAGACNKLSQQYYCGHALAQMSSFSFCFPLMLRIPLGRCLKNQKTDPWLNDRFLLSGGETGIRTLEAGISRLLDFESSAFNRTRPSLHAILFFLAV